MRTCAQEWCSHPIDHLRSTARYCGASCRAADSRRRIAERLWTKAARNLAQRRSVRRREGLRGIV